MMTDGNGREKGDWKYFLVFTLKVLALFVLLFGVAFGMFWARRYMAHHG